MERIAVKSGQPIPRVTVAMADDREAEEPRPKQPKQGAHEGAQGSAPGQGRSGKAARVRRRTPAPTRARGAAASRRRAPAARLLRAARSAAKLQQQFGLREPARGPAAHEDRAQRGDGRRGEEPEGSSTRRSTSWAPSPGSSRWSPAPRRRSRTSTSARACPIGCAVTLRGGPDVRVPGPVHHARGAAHPRLPRAARTRASTAGATTRSASRSR